MRRDALILAAALAVAAAAAAVVATVDHVRALWRLLNDPLEDIVS